MNFGGRPSPKCLEAEPETESAGTDAAGLPEIVCFVSSRDVCRGPVCAAVYNALAKERGCVKKAMSCGIDAEDGAPVSMLALRALKESGYLCEGDNGTHHSMRVSRLMAECSEAVIAVDDDIAMKLMFAFPDLASKIRCLSEPLNAPADDTAEKYIYLVMEAERLIKTMTGETP